MTMLKVGMCWWGPLALHVAAQIEKKKISRCSATIYQSMVVIMSYLLVFILTAISWVLGWMVGSTYWG